MQLSRRTFYHRPKVAAADPALVDRIEQSCLEYPRYGYRCVTDQLKREGLSINHKKVSRIMREHNWYAVGGPATGLPPPIAATGCRSNPNLIANRRVDGINQVWVADLSVLQQPSLSSIRLRH